MHFRCLYAPAVDVCCIRLACTVEPLSFGTRCLTAGVRRACPSTGHVSMRQRKRWAQCSVCGAVDDGRKSGSAARGGIAKAFNVAYCRFGGE